MGVVLCYSHHLIFFFRAITAGVDVLHRVRVQCRYGRITPKLDIQRSTSNSRLCMSTSCTEFQVLCSLSLQTVLVTTILSLSTCVEWRVPHLHCQEEYCTVGLHNRRSWYHPQHVDYSQRPHITCVKLQRIRLCYMGTKKCPRRKILVFSQTRKSTQQSFYGDKNGHFFFP